MTRRARPTWTLRMIHLLLPPLAISLAMAQEPPAAPEGGEPAGTQESGYVLSRADAVKSALENNLDLLVRAYDPLRNEALVIAAESIFDPALAGSVTSSNTQIPSPLVFLPKNKVHNYTASFLDPTLTGGSYQISVGAQDTDASRFSVDPITGAPILVSSVVFDTSWRVSVTQPLLRNLGPKVNKSFVVVARNTLGISEQAFRQTVINTVSSAEKAYWDLNFSLMNLKTNQAALKLAQDFLEQNRIKVRVGTLAPIEITQAEAQVADREETVIIAENLVKTAEDNLRSVMNVPKDSPVWSQSIEPSDPLPLVEQSPDMEASVATALAHRPDLEQQRLDLKTRETNLAYFKNQRRWNLNLSGDYGKDGLDEFTYSNSLDDLQRGENLDWRVSLALGIPIGNRKAVAGYTEAEYALAQSQSALQTLELGARVEVRNAVRQVETTLKRVKSAQVNVRLQKEKLSAEQKKFENGMSTSFQVLQFQNDLFQAVTRENLAMVDYNKSQVELDRVMGTLLEARNIQMPSNDSRRTEPYHPHTHVDGAPGGDRRPGGAEPPSESADAMGTRLPTRFVFEGRHLVAKDSDLNTSEHWPFDDAGRTSAAQ